MKIFKIIVFKKQIWAIATLLLICNEVAYGQISGTVFRDFNGNGTKESAEPLVAGVEVKAYDTAGTQCGTTQTTTAASAPNYTLSGCTGAVRVEFSIPAGTCFADNGIDYAALGGGAHGTSVQFLTNTSAATRTANFALFYPGEYGGETSFVPDLYNVIHRAGNPTPSPVAPSGDASYTANKSAVTSTGYFENGLVITTFAQGGAASIAQRQVGHTTLALAGQVGTLWGNAYGKHAERLFVSAFLRRHAGMGPGGPGAIYMINPTSPNLTGNLLFANLDALGFPTHAASGAYNIKSNTARNLVAQPLFTPSTDADAYDQVGKTSLGDLDISENGQFLFVTNLFDRKLYRIDLQNPITPQVPTAAQITSYSIPDPCTGVANAGEYRPFGLKVFKGKLYAGIMCSGQDASNNEIGTSATMSLHLFAFDLGTTNTPTTPTVVYTQSMAYRDNDAIRGTGATPTVTHSARWRPWKNEFVTTENHPMFTDIEFDNNGNFLLGLTDRNGFQTGGGQYNLSGSGPHTKFYANGDILKITKDATCSLSMATGSYFQNDLYQDQSRWGTPLTGSPYSHAEIALGGVTSHRFGDRDEVVTTALNPVSFTSNGYVAFNNTNGQQERANELWWDSCNLSTEACMDKAGGLGDLEVMGLPAPIEIGNRVWLDADNDGIQDAGEAGISGVQV
ncbi:MAG TPA: SdrD B-like domain-containing protein, partial [Rhodothermales bacterium]|nr:SdrD B-like domain-containing protein [Rhodothermales bacterium]